MLIMSKRPQLKKKKKAIFGTLEINICFLKQKNYLLILKKLNDKQHSHSDVKKEEYKVHKVAYGRIGVSSSVL